MAEDPSYTSSDDAADGPYAEHAAGEQRIGERIRAALASRTAIAIAIAVVVIALVTLAQIQGTGWQRLLSLTIWGITFGSIIALGAIGLTLIYGVVKFPNFSHGGLVTLGAYVAYTVVTVWPGQSAALRPLSFGWDLVVGLFVAMPVVGLVALVLDRLVYRRLRRQQASLVLFAMASLAMAFLLRSVLYITWGSDFHFYYSGRANPAMALPFNIRIQADQLFTLGLAITLVVALYLMLERTRLGKAMRATANNPELAQIRGINTEKIIGWTWLLSGALAAAGGVIYGLASQVRPEMGFYLLIPIFAAVIMGGIGNPRGALAGALIVGVTQQVSSAFISPAYGPAIAFLLMIIVLLLRPQGLFGH
ncbi:branched-chain amino acid ABC transporter permease [Salinisphaera sp. USBA-960]|uniref:branched-chain amino acid ABC transporter permease n=1 Tax=Salinisphaera orenii TaxID=856731 RepID=UPI000DBE25F3|nr:branched-chain amino acid ABC transporter permease [Salifodinibacter halophilus]NNC27098.1 branched-chain amino acid ABC transporter permease [Salifodinibacter halophilus]